MANQTRRFRQSMCFMALLAATVFSAPALADSYGYRGSCFEDEPGPAREWTVNVAVGFEPDPDGGRRVVRRPVEMRFPAICTDVYPPLDRSGLTFEVDIGGRCVSRLESRARTPFNHNLARLFLYVDIAAGDFESHAKIFNTYDVSPDFELVRFDVGPEDALGLHPLRYSDVGQDERDEAWFVHNDAGAPIGHLRCTRIGKAPNPICEQYEKFGEVMMSATYNRTSLRRWREIGAQMRRYFECAVKDTFPGVR